jgi:hypothetical protein
MKKHLDIWSRVVIVLTFILFVLALFIKGLTHEMLQEVGVFLVSLKLILMSHKNGVIAADTQERLQQIHNLLRKNPEWPSC